MTAETTYPSDAERRSVEVEYKALRDEILKRIEMRQQIISIALPLAGVFLGVGLTREAVALIYPPLATFLALSWAQNDFRIRVAAKYIRDNIEAPSPDSGMRRTCNRPESLRGKGSGPGALSFWPTAEYSWSLS